MAIRTILVPLFGNGTDARMLDAAAEIAGRMTAHITALYCDADASDPLYPLSGWESATLFSNTLIKTLQERSETRRANAERAFSQWRSRTETPIADRPAAAHHASAELAMASGKLEKVLMDHAVVSDLVVGSVGGAGDPDRATALAVMLFDARRPVLALPADAKGSLLASPAAVAWNYSAESARALTAALPILGVIGEAAVLMAGRHEDDDAAKRVATFLAWHGIRARVHKLGQAGKPAELISAKVRELGSGLLVMGAYSHTRARESVFGGMTGYMLEKAPVPLLLAR